jgi:hypothetical protein
MQTQPPHLDGLQRLAGHGVALRVAEQRQQVRVVSLTHTLSHSPSPMQTQPPHLDGLQRLAGHGVALRVAEQRQQVRVVA